MASIDTFDSRATLDVDGRSYEIFRLDAVPGLERLPYSLKVLAENLLRTEDGANVTADHVRALAAWDPAAEPDTEIQFTPARVIMQDFTGVPCIVDLATMREAVADLGGDPEKINPLAPAEMVIDHSVQIDSFGLSSSLERNKELEYRRNAERYQFLRWGQGAFSNFRVVPPGTGIVHQVNIEYLARTVFTKDVAGPGGAVVTQAYPDTCVGTDSHTTTVNGMGVLGWGVGGIEAEAASLGQPISLLVPAVVELRLTGALHDGVSGMDVALTVAKLLRDAQVVGNLVEVTGPGVSSLTPTQRACVANMTPEYGCTTTLFPVDENVLDYLRLTGRAHDQVDLVRAYFEAEGVFGAGGERRYARTLTLDLATVGTSLAGPSRPHNHVTPATLQDAVRHTAEAHGLGDFDETFEITMAGETHQLHRGTLAIAAITSCTTATDPAMMVAAGLLAKKAREHGLSAKPWVKRILAPGSHAPELLLERTGLARHLFELGFYTCGFGCMSCIGNSGGIAVGLSERAGDMELTSILSGNRNFDGRISPDVAQNYLAAPALVVAYALVGTLDVDLSHTPVGRGSQGEEVMLDDLMPTNDEVSAALAGVLTTELFEEGARGLFEGSPAWRELKVAEGDTFSWDPASTYVRRAPYFEIARHEPMRGASGARTLAFLGDFVTTDHISPAGAISPTAPAADYLRAHGVAEGDFNTYGSRRGNHEVMTRGTFANVRLENALAEGVRGWWTEDLLTGEAATIFAAAEHYRERGVDAIVVAGRMYGSGSSRDWAAKGPLLLGVRAVIAESFERIHRSNLVQMGVLPLQFMDGDSARSLGLTGRERYDIEEVDLTEGLPRHPVCQVTATAGDGKVTRFGCIVRVDTPTEGRFLAFGGILPYILERMTGACPA